MLQDTESGVVDAPAIEHEAAADEDQPTIQQPRRPMPYTRGTSRERSQRVAHTKPDRLPDGQENKKYGVYAPDEVLPPIVTRVIAGQVKLVPNWTAGWTLSKFRSPNQIYTLTVQQQKELAVSNNHLFSFPIVTHPFPGLYPALGPEVSNSRSVVPVARGGAL